MKHMKLVTMTLALLCALSLAGCGSSNSGQAANNEPSSYNQNENQSGGENSNTSNETSTNLDDLLETALLRGSVADFQDGSFQVVPMEADAQTTKLAASGMESTLESTTVSYGEDCTFQIANINSSTGAVELEAATASNVKKSTSVYVYGETQDDGEIHATKVLITRFN